MGSAQDTAERNCNADYSCTCNITLCLMLLPVEQGTLGGQRSPGIYATALCSIGAL